MLAATLINPMIPVLKLTDSVSTALDWMDEFSVKQLIVADSGIYQGIVSEDILFDITDNTDPLAKIIIQHKDIFAAEDQHPYELLRLVNQFGLQIIPVLHEDRSFAGSILVNDLIEHFVNELGVQEKGAVIVLKIAERSYSLSEISRLIESNGTKVLSSYYSSGESYNPLNEARLTLKLNRTHITPIIATLERFGYEIEEAHANDPIESVDQERLDMLLRYLAT
ncbi:CBS domain-containing protein [Dyadobacter fanqingshengii]|uniref:CBS domain-containing protein n=1 Tax=Dyadobacter fanqingshengii TaxID=2906443 RepID=A0A9X1PE74_9BACT|nr:CBS domain-containing protein [Dyadobacter fanqingshengii]MCF0043561.1 CBS domain-containing protein [Dyadobacter fanqingshengii]MCF2504090.1 CBS domain-containing protein [Dyadobacter fanqingshengii]USJ34820.1 CBS domain-containing protein [Dyadobacter fanqingshengii]